MDDIAVKDVLLSVGENINPARDIVGPVDVKEATVEFVLTKTYFENLAVLMQEYLETTTLGDLIRKARGEKAVAAQAGVAATIGAPAVELNRRVDTDLS
jgi:DNA-binding IscR family transcriptional regulator